MPTEENLDAIIKLATEELIKRYWDKGETFVGVFDNVKENQKKIIESLQLKLFAGNRKNAESIKARF